MNSHAWSGYASKIGRQLDDRVFYGPGLTSLISYRGDQEGFRGERPRSEPRSLLQVGEERSEEVSRRSTNLDIAIGI